MSDNQALNEAMRLSREMQAAPDTFDSENERSISMLGTEIIRLRAQLSEQAARADSFKDTCEELRERTDQFDWKTGECEHGIIGNYSTCNGSNKGCERSRFLHCCYCMKRDFMNKQRAEAAEQKLKAVEGERDSLRFQALNSTPTAELLRRTLEAENGRDAYMALVNQAQDGQNRAEADLETASKENAELKEKLADAVQLTNAHYDGKVRYRDLLAKLKDDNATLRDALGKAETKGFNRGYDVAELQFRIEAQTSMTAEPAIPHAEPSTCLPSASDSVRLAKVLAVIEAAEKALIQSHGCATVSPITSECYGCCVLDALKSIRALRENP